MMMIVSADSAESGDTCVAEAGSGAAMLLHLAPARFLIRAILRVSEGREVAARPVIKWQRPSSSCTASPQGRVAIQRSMSTRPKLPQGTSSSRLAVVCTAKSH